MKISGDYGTVMDSEELMANPNNSAQSGQFSKADLVGRRFVSTSDTDEGKQLAESKIQTW